MPRSLIVSKSMFNDVGQQNTTKHKQNITYCRLFFKDQSNKDIGVRGGQSKWARDFKVFFWGIFTTVRTKFYSISNDVMMR
jgi:hypothetical protein